MNILVISRSRMVRYYYQSYAEDIGRQICFLTAASICKVRGQFDAVLLDRASLSARAIEEVAEYYSGHPVFVIGGKNKGLGKIAVAGFLSSDLSLHEIINIIEISLSDGALPSLKTQSLAVVEEAILECLAQGATDKEIARDFNLCLSTVKYHLRRLYRKLNVTNRTQAALIASKIIV